MDALDLLHDDHERIKGLVDDLEQTSDQVEQRREQAFAAVRRDLEAHERIEEEIFYPALEQHPRARDLVLEGYVEHGVVERLTSELEAMPVDDELWGPKAKVMIENLRHHIQEEEGELFPKARQVFDERELTDLGERMATLRSELLVAADAPNGRDR